MEWLDRLDAKAVSAMITAGSDIALVLDNAGVIRDVTVGDVRFAQSFDDIDKWTGLSLADCVTAETRQKTVGLLRNAADGAPPRRVHLNHRSQTGSSIAVQYSAVRLGSSGAIIALGRDLSPLSVLQQRLVDAQQAMERDYLNLRQVETRYRLLFEMSAEAVLIMDANTLRTVEINPAARNLFGEAAKPGVSRSLAEIFDAESLPAVQAHLAIARSVGRADEIPAKLAHLALDVFVAAALFRQESVPLFLVRLAPASIGAALPVPVGTRAQLLQAVEGAPDGFVVTNPDGTIIAANAAFLDMAQLSSEEQAKGASLDNWLGRPGVDLGVLIANLKQRGSVRLFATTIRGQFGASADAEISAASVQAGHQRCNGFVIRNVGRRIATDPRVGRELPRTVEQLTDLIGRASLKELVREAADMIERLCIEAALELTGDNRASAAELLGLSRQSLYVKLHRYGLGDLTRESGN